MRKKLTITIDERVYEGLHTVIGRRRISRFIEDLVRPLVLSPDLEAAYREMAREEKREAQSLDPCTHPLLLRRLTSGIGSTGSRRACHSAKSLRWAASVSACWGSS